MTRKPVLGTLAALAASAALCVSAPTQAQYYQYQSQQYPYQTQQQYYQYQNGQYYAYPSQQSYPYQSQYSYGQQYAPAQPQYAPAVSYRQLPQYCLQNNTATGAILGTLIGAALGGAFGGGRGAAIGAGSGLLFGGLSGAQADAQCQQIATQIAYERAAAQQAAIERQIEQQIAQQAAQQQAAAAQSMMLTLPAAAYQPVSEDYHTPSNGHRHRITVRRLNSYSAPAAHMICDTFTKIDADLDGNTSNTSTARRCKGSDGVWHDA